MDQDGRAFVDEMGRFFASYGLSHAHGRVFAYLLLASEPMSLDQIAQDLEISKSGASTTARQLEGWNLARSIPARGSRRIRYEPTTGFESLLSAGLQKIERFWDTVEAGRRVAADGAPQARLAELAEVLGLYVTTVQQALAHVHEQRQTRPRGRA